MYLGHKHIKLRCGTRAFVLSDRVGCVDCRVNNFLFTYDKCDIIGYYEKGKYIPIELTGSVFDNIIRHN